METTMLGPHRQTVRCGDRGRDGLAAMNSPLSVDVLAGAEDLRRCRPLKTAHPQRQDWRDRIAAPPNSLLTNMRQVQVRAAGAAAKRPGSRKGDRCVGIM